MKSTLILTALAVVSISQQALAAVTVPEIDGSSAILALGLTAAVVALIRERIKK